MSVAFSFNVLTATVVTPSLPAKIANNNKNSMKKRAVQTIGIEKYIYVQKSNIKVLLSYTLDFIKTRSMALVMHVLHSTNK